MGFWFWTFLQLCRFPISILSHLLAADVNAISHGKPAQRSFLLPRYSNKQHIFPCIFYVHKVTIIVTIQSLLNCFWSPPTRWMGHPIVSFQFDAV